MSGDCVCLILAKLLRLPFVYVPVVDPISPLLCVSTQHSLSTVFTGLALLVLQCELHVG